MHRSRRKAPKPDQWSSDGIEYVRLKIVTYHGGNEYICRQSHTSDDAKAPPLPEHQQNLYWTLQPVHKATTDAAAAMIMRLTSPPQQSSSK
ncbi:hypothetical protein BDZ89DRAFT_1169225 [Hymenopellis radicata]|nr:hypothetical protein BDZ89DRAFT_1169225 [Hymenopellis radicata]